MELIISPKRTIIILSIIVIILTITSVAGDIYKHFTGHGRYLVDLFDLDQEWNIPTFYASFSLLFCTVLLVIITLLKIKYKNKFSKHWLILSLIFLYLAMDESIQFHEQVNTPLRSVFNTEGFFYFAWVIPGIVLMFIFLLTFFKFIVDLPAKTRYLFIISGTIYVIGALRMELIGGAFLGNINDQQHIIYIFITTIEEFLEMIGILIFLCALLSYLKENFQGIIINFKD